MIRYLPINTEHIAGTPANPDYSVDTISNFPEACMLDKEVGKLGTGRGNRAAKYSLT